MTKGVLLAACCVLVIACMFYTADASPRCVGYCKDRCRHPRWNRWFGWNKNRPQLVAKWKSACLLRCEKLFSRCDVCPFTRRCTSCETGYHLFYGLCVKNPPPTSRPCDSSPCLNGGSCRNVGQTYVCDCPAFWTGANCQISNLVRLADGPNNASGRVEVLHSGEWGTVCGAAFDDNAARVVCHSLGFGYIGWYLEGLYGPGAGRIWLAGVNCYGNENTLPDCQNYLGWGNLISGCTHQADVSVVCSQEKPDPCEPNPCHTGVACALDGTVVCDCGQQYAGQFCELQCPTVCPTGTYCDTTDGVTATCSSL